MNKLVMTMLMAAMIAFTAQPLISYAEDGSEYSGEYYDDSQQESESGGEEYPDAESDGETDDTQEGDEESSAQ